MAKLRNLPKAAVDMNTALGVVIENTMSRLNCHNIGKILEFDPETQTCTVEMQQIKQFQKTYYNPAPLTEVPLLIYGGVGAHITLPDPVGSICVVLFMDRDIDNFLLTGEMYAPNTTRMHDFTDCIAITTFKTLVDPIAEYDTEALSLLHSEILENVKNDTYLKLYPDKTENKVSKTVTDDEGQETTTYSMIDVVSDGITLAASAGGQVVINSKLQLSNTAQSLATLMQSFLTACENIAVDTQTGLLTAGSKQAFTELKSQFGELLQ